MYCMPRKTFSLQLCSADTAKVNETKLDEFDEKINRFLSENEGFTASETLQSSAADSVFGFTTVTVVLTK